MKYLLVTVLLIASAEKVFGQGEQPAAQDKIAIPYPWPAPLPAGLSCPGYCPRNYQPLCATVQGVDRDFSNSCELVNFIRCNPCAVIDNIRCGTCRRVCWPNDIAVDPVAVDPVAADPVAADPVAVDQAAVAKAK